MQMTEQEVKTRPKRKKPDIFGFPISANGILGFRAYASKSNRTIIALAYEENKYIGKFPT